jgi:hypothetical protein
MIRNRPAMHFLNIRTRMENIISSYYLRDQHHDDLSLHLLRNICDHKVF